MKTKWDKLKIILADRLDLHENIYKNMVENKAADGPLIKIGSMNELKDLISIMEQLEKGS